MNTIATPEAPSTLTASHRRTYEAIFRHPASHNLAWREVHALFRQLGQVTEEPNGNLKVLRNGQTLVLPPPRTKDVAETSELMALRAFLERSQTPPPVPTAGKTEAHWVVAINHHEARIFHSDVPGSVPEQILPRAPADHFRSAPNAKDFSRGREKPDPNAFFGPVASALKAAGRIVIFGSGKGTGSEMEQLIAWLHRHHPEISRRIVGSMVIDGHHLSDAQLLAQAREFFAQPAAIDAASR